MLRTLDFGLSSELEFVYGIGVLNYLASFAPKDIHFLFCSTSLVLFHVLVGKGLTQHNSDHDVPVRNAERMNFSSCAGKSDIRVIVVPPPSFLTFVLGALRWRFHDTELVLATKSDRRRLNWSKWLRPVVAWNQSHRRAFMTW